MSGPSARELDRLTVTRLTGAAWRHASRWEPAGRDAAGWAPAGWEPAGRGPAGREAAEAETAAAVRELREIAGARGDLLAEVAGLLIGYYRRTAEELKARAAAYYCIAAGAGVELIPRWIEVGCSRAAAARLIPPAVPEASQGHAWPEAV
jgi:hypothetical protein